MALLRIKLINKHEETNPESVVITEKQKKMYANINNNV